MQIFDKLIPKQAAIVEQLGKIVLEFPHPLFDEFKIIIGTVPKSKGLGFGEFRDQLRLNFLNQLQVELF